MEKASNGESIGNLQQREFFQEEPDVKEIHARIGQLAMENDFLSVALKLCLKRKETIDKEHTLPVTKQCLKLEPSRSSFYYVPVPVSDEDRELMCLIDGIHLEELCLGSRGIKSVLKRKGCKAGRIHVRTLMRKTGIEAIYKKPRLSKPHPEHKIYPLSSSGA